MLEKNTIIEALEDRILACEASIRPTLHKQVPGLKAAVKLIKELKEEAV